MRAIALVLLAVAIAAAQDVQDDPTQPTPKEAAEALAAYVAYQHEVIKRISLERALQGQIQELLKRQDDVVNKKAEESNSKKALLDEKYPACGFNPATGKCSKDDKPKN